MTPTYTAAECVNLLGTLDSEGIDLLCALIDEEPHLYTKQELNWIMNTLAGIYYHRINKM